MSRKKTYDQYKEIFIAGVMDTINMDYSDMASVRKNNRGVDQYRKAAKNIGLFYPEQIEEFSKLLFHPEPEIRICCAVCLVELMGASGELKTQAIDYVKRYQKESNEVVSFQIKYWLKQYS